MAQPINPDVDRQSLLHASHGYRPAAANGTWSTGLCQCYAEPGGCGVCLLSACLPCAQYGITVEKLGPQATCGSSCLGAGLFYWLMVSMGLGCLPQVITRSEIRKMHGIQLDSVSDCLTACCCSPCGLCQEAREVEIRHGSDARRGGPKGTCAAPPETQNMTETC